MAADRYASQAASYAVSNMASKHGSYHKQDSGDQVPQVLFEKDLHVPSDIGIHETASEISLRSEYTHLDNDTNRYPKLTRSLSASSNTMQSEDKGQDKSEWLHHVSKRKKTHLAPRISPSIGENGDKSSALPNARRRFTAYKMGCERLACPH